MIKTKQELLNHFSDINTMYNNPFMYQTLSNMIDELLEQQPCDDAISRAEALRIAKSYYHAEYVVDKIRQLPSVTPKAEPCEDAISRQDAVDIINGYAEQFNGYIGTPNDTEVYAYARGLLLGIERNISALPPVMPKGESESDD